MVLLHLLVTDMKRKLDVWKLNNSNVMVTTQFKTIDFTAF
jgi:hypothetical protein